jgi:hypothetical protein
LKRKVDAGTKIFLLADSLREVHQFAGDNLRTSQARQKRDYDLRVVQHAYQEGDLVCKLDSSSKIGQSRKQRSPWMGPFLVIGSRPPLYRIQDKKKEYVVYHDRLKRCHDRHIPLWLRRLRHDLFNTPMPDLEQSGIDPDETLPYCDGFP